MDLDTIIEKYTEKLGKPPDEIKRERGPEKDGHIEGFAMWELKDGSTFLVRLINSAFGRWEDVYKNVNGLYHREDGPARMWYDEDGVTRSWQFWKRGSLVRNSDEMLAAYPENLKELLLWV